EADCAVVPDAYVRGMYFINVHKLANPDVVPDRNSAQPLQPWSQAESPRGYESYPTRQPTEKWQCQWLLPLITGIRNQYSKRCTDASRDNRTSREHCAPLLLTGVRSVFAQVADRRRPWPETPTHPPSSIPRTAASSGRYSQRKNATSFATRC